MKEHSLHVEMDVLASIGIPMQKVQRGAIHLIEDRYSFYDFYGSLYRCVMADNMVASKDYLLYLLEAEDQVNLWPFTSPPHRYHER